MQLRTLYIKDSDVNAESQSKAPNRLTSSVILEDPNLKKVSKGKVKILINYDEATNEYMFLNLSLDQFNELQKSVKAAQTALSKSRG
ncbi:hypothetical protein SprV_0401539100 [Sparganum proliferum]